jgi:predicted component of type VI protein secretion system
MQPVGFGASMNSRRQGAQRRAGAGGAPAPLPDRAPDRDPDPVPDPDLDVDRDPDLDRNLDTEPGLDPARAIPYLARKKRPGAPAARTSWWTSVRTASAMAWTVPPISSSKKRERSSGG